jgi:hypothetical protein
MATPKMTFPSEDWLPKRPEPDPGVSSMRPSAQPVRVAMAPRPSPAKLGVFSMQDGKLIASLGTCGDADDVFLDAKRHRAYVSCGGGAIDVVDANEGGSRRIAMVLTAADTRTRCSRLSLIACSWQLVPSRVSPPRSESFDHCRDH